jgi:hypothetical protein
MASSGDSTRRPAEFANGPPALEAAGTTDFTIDAATLNGTAVGTTGGPACGYSTPYTGYPSAFTLTKVG